MEIISKAKISSDDFFREYQNVIIENHLNKKGYIFEKSALEERTSTCCLKVNFYNHIADIDELEHKYSKELAPKIQSAFEDMGQVTIIKLS
jgi:hypothetical protein